MADMYWTADVNKDVQTNVLSGGSELDLEDSKFVIPLTEFLDDFGDSLLEAVASQNPPVYDGVPDPRRTEIMAAMKRKPFEAQQRVIQTASRLLIDEGGSTCIVNAEMGTGKTLMSIAISECMYREGKAKRFLVLSPPHLVYKFRREIHETIENARVWVLNGPDTLAKLIQLRESLGASEHEGPEFYILGRVRLRMGHHWKPAVAKRKRHEVRKANPYDPESERISITHEYAACADCGTTQVDEEGEAIHFAAFKSDKPRVCRECQSPLWTLRRPETKTKTRKEIVIESLCRIPTIGPKTAQKLVSLYGAEMMEDMLADNIFDFINLMDENGDLIFSDRKAERMERALAKTEFGFGQGGYQASEFIKRYLPSGYFDLAIVDEIHEYKNASAQGLAMGVVASKVRKVLALTGSLSGGYASDLFKLFWRLIGPAMREDGYRCNARGSLGSAEAAFMREHGVLKDVYKEVEGDAHKTARGKKTTVRTSKAPGFSPMAVGRYLLPYTVFLKLREIGEGVLPDYREELIQVPMNYEQEDAYKTMASVLQETLKRALVLGDATLLGVVLNALLRWPDTCFRPETIVHPRTRDLIHFTGSVIDEDELSPKESEMIRLCKEEKAKGRRSLVYTVYTGKQDVATRYKRLLEDAGLKTAVLRSSVDPEKREDWILDQVDRGIDVLICNPELVKTGMDLYDFPTLIFNQTGFNVYTVIQASRRSWRIGQKRDVVVYFLGYEATAQQSCLELMGKKIAVAQSTSGDMPDTGLDVLNQGGESMEVELAKQLTAEIDLNRKAA